MAATNVLIQGEPRALSHRPFEDNPLNTSIFFDLESKIPSEPFNPNQMHEELKQNHNLEYLTQEGSSPAGGETYIYSTSLGEKDIQVNPVPRVKAVRLGIYGKTYKQLKDIGALATATSIFNTIVPIIENPEHYTINTKTAETPTLEYLSENDPTYSGVTAVAIQTLAQPNWITETYSDSNHFEQSAESSIRGVKLFAVSDLDSKYIPTQVDELSPPFDMN